MVGTKEGTLDVLEIGSGDRIQSIQAHSGAIWAVTPLPDSSGLVSGSADHEVKFWEWEVVPPCSRMQNLPLSSDVIRFNTASLSYRPHMIDSTRFLVLYCPIPLLSMTSEAHIQANVRTT